VCSGHEEGSFFFLSFPFLTAAAIVMTMVCVCERVKKWKSFRLGWLFRLIGSRCVVFRWKMHVTDNYFRALMMSVMTLLIVCE